MSTELVACPHCGTNLQNTAAIAGQIVACPQCQTQLQMPALSMPLPDAGIPMPVMPQSVPELPQAVSTGAPAGIAIDTVAQQSGEAPKAIDRLRRRTNPVPIIIGVAVVCILVAIVVVGVMFDRADDQRNEATMQLTGNWESVAGEGGSPVQSLAFHSDGQFQVLLEASGQGEVLDGRWKVTRVSGTKAYVSVDWLDGTGETMIVQMSGRQLDVELPSVGNLKFRAVTAGG